jgi:hypothetical protein
MPRYGSPTAPARPRDKAVGRAAAGAAARAQQPPGLAAPAGRAGRRPAGRRSCPIPPATVCQTRWSSRPPPGSPPATVALPAGGLSPWHGMGGVGRTAGDDGARHRFEANGEEAGEAACPKLWLLPVQPFALPSWVRCCHTPAPAGYSADRAAGPTQCAAAGVLRSALRHLPGGAHRPPQVRRHPAPRQFHPVRPRTSHPSTTTNLRCGACGPRAPTSTGPAGRTR